MNKKILLSLALTSLIPLSSFAEADLSNVSVSGNVGIMTETFSSAQGNLTAFEEDSTRIGAYANVKVSADMTDEISGYINLTGVDSINAKYNIQGSEKTDAVLEEAYIKYKNSENIIKVGRTTFDSPLIYSDNYRPITNTYDMLSIANKSFNNTYLYGGVILRDNSVDNFNFTGVNKIGDTENTPMFIGGLLYKGIEKFPVQAWIYGQSNGKFATYANAEAQFTKDLNLAVQYSYISDNSVDISDDITVLGSQFDYNVNERWNVKVAFDNVSKGDSFNSPANMNNQRTSKLYTSLRTVGELMGTDEASISHTTSFSVKAKGNLDNGLGKLCVAYGSYHHESGTSYNNNANTTHAVQATWKQTYMDHFSSELNLGYISYQTADLANPTANIQQDGAYAALRVNYSF